MSRKVVLTAAPRTLSMATLLEETEAADAENTVFEEEVKEPEPVVDNSFDCCEDGDCEEADPEDEVVSGESADAAVDGA